MSNVILALPAECWRWYDGYVGLYQVSTRGQVRRVGRWVTGKDGKKRFLKERVLKPWRNKGGYLMVNLWRDGKMRHFQVHRMVAETWLDNPEKKPQVNHLDETRTNDVYNLSWASAKENANWGTRNKRIGASQLNGSKSKPVLALDPKTGQVVHEFPSTAEAERKGFDSRHICACCKGKVFSHKGFVWRYKDGYDQESAWTPVKIRVADSLPKPVQALDPSTGEVVLEFPSTREAGRKGFSQGNICSCCQGKRKTHKGYMWRYEE